MNKIDISSGAVGNNIIIKNVFNNAMKKIDSSMLYSYPNPLGLDILRKQIADLLSIDKTILITNSATEALYLSLSNIIGYNIAIQSPSYFGVIRQLKQLKINHLSWNNIEELKKISDSGNIKAIYLNSNCNAIDGQCLSEGEKREIIDIGQNRGIQVIEDNPCDLLSFDKIGSNISNNLHNSIYMKFL